MVLALLAVLEGVGTSSTLVAAIAVAGACPSAGIRAWTDGNDVSEAAIYLISNFVRHSIAPLRVLVVWINEKEIGQSPRDERTLFQRAVQKAAR